MNIYPGTAGASPCKAPVRKLTMDGPVAVLGDIHGEIGLLDKLLTHLGDMPIVCVGDLVDRGPSSKDVIARLIERGARSTQGNHDLWFRTWALRGEMDPGCFEVKAMAVSPTLVSYGVDPNRKYTASEIGRKGPFLVPDDHQKWLEDMPFLIDLVVDHVPFYVMHAGVSGFWLKNFWPPKMGPYDADAALRLAAKMCDQGVVPAINHLLWEGQRHEDAVKLSRPIIHGHDRQKEPKDWGHVIPIDLGCGYQGGALCAVLLPERRFVIATETGVVTL